MNLYHWNENLCNVVGKKFQAAFEISNPVSQSLAIAYPGLQLVCAGGAKDGWTGISGPMFQSVVIFCCH